jgi:hypothetical protein
MQWLRRLQDRFEVLFYLQLWAWACILAALAGRPWLGAIGLVTVLPFAVAASRR